jgi:hypothetical protein
MMRTTILPSPKVYDPDLGLAAAVVMLGMFDEGNRGGDKPHDGPRDIGNYLATHALLLFLNLLP